MTVVRALGLMSGTSMDGVDVALIETDGETEVTFGPHDSFPYTADDRRVLRGALADAVGLNDRDARPGALAQAETLVTDKHAEAVEAFLAGHAIAPSSIAMVGFHGQTVLHRPDKKLTVQIGHGQGLAARLGIPVAWDFRADDVAGRGQGAPLVPVYHRALVDRAKLDGPIVVINIGGVANLTFIASGCDPIACDTGPGNALLDDLVLERTGQPFDRDGALSSVGTVDAEILAAMLAHPFFALPAPKSLDRNAFSRAAVTGLATADAAATLAALTAASIVRAVEAMPALPERAIVCGGGGHNPTIMRELVARLPCRPVSASEMGWSIDAMEAQAFAYLAVRCAKNLPITFPGTTGIGAPLTGGRISLP